MMAVTVFAQLGQVLGLLEVVLVLGAVLVLFLSLGLNWLRYYFE